MFSCGHYTNAYNTVTGSRITSLIYTYIYLYEIYSGLSALGLRKKKLNETDSFHFDNENAVGSVIQFIN